MLWRFQKDNCKNFRLFPCRLPPDLTDFAAWMNSFRRLLCFLGAMYCSLWLPALKKQGQEADIRLFHHNHRCIFEANSLRPTELSWDVGYNIPSSAGKSLYCNQPNHSNTPTGVFGRDFLHFLYIYCTTYKERIYGYVKFSRYQFMVYKRLIA